MSYETVITALLVILAFLLGALLACLIRRWMRSPEPEVSVNTPEQTESSPRISTSIAATGKPAQTKSPQSSPKKSAAKKPIQARGLKAAIGGKADDLKQISGVGPKLEKILNGLGIFHFEQIAGWRAKDIAEVDDLLSFKGRIERDKWVVQTKKLAK